MQGISSDHKVILITVAVIDGLRLWANGLHQNGVFLYRLFECAGYKPIFLTNNKPNSEESKHFRVLDFSEYDKNPFPVYAFIEVGLNCLETRRVNLRKNGTKVFKLFLGNELNADIESIVHTDDREAHHTSGSHGSMLHSAHHYFTQEYISALYNVYPYSKIAPYIWDSGMLNDLIDSYKWPNEGPYSFTIMEPNLSFLKCSLVPMMICEAFYRENPRSLEGVVVINGAKLTNSKYFLTNILTKLDLYQHKRLFLIKRLTVRAAATNFKQNIIIHHAVNNDYNYLFLEYLFMGFPVIHNYAMLKAYGYYYKGNDIEAGKNMINYVINNHGSNLEAYKASCKQLFWRFSIYNPENIMGWQKILDDS